MGPEKAQVTISKSSSLTSTSITYRAFQKVNTKTASQNTAVVRLVNMVRHDLDMSGLGPSFCRFCSSLNAQRMNFLPHAALNGRTPASILYPDRSLPFKYFLPFDCKATVLKGFAVRKASKLDPRGRDGIYIGTAAPYGMQGYLVYVFPEGGKGFGTAGVATHAKFDVTFFPAHRNNKRVRESFATLPACLNEKGVTDDLADIADVVEIDTHNDTDDDPCEVELVADAAVPSKALEIANPTAVELVADAAASWKALQIASPVSPVIPPDATTTALDDFDRITWDINEAHERALDNIIDSLTEDINANDFVVKSSPSMHVPAPNLADTDDDEAAPDPLVTDDEDDRDTRSATTSQEWPELKKHARNQVDTGRRLQSGTVHARSSHVYHPDDHALIKNIIRAAHPVENDVREQAHAARTFAYELTKSEQRYEHAFHASAPATPPPAPYAQSRPSCKFKTSVSCAVATSLISKRLSYSTS
jgi:hypothetical protein